MKTVLEVAKQRQQKRRQQAKENARFYFRPSMQPIRIVSGIKLEKLFVRE